MKKNSNKLIGTAGSALLFALLAGTTTFAEECNEVTMDAFAYEDCLAAKGITPSAGAATAKESNTEQTGSKPFSYSPFGRDAYLTSSFGENRGTRYHLGIDYSTQMEEGWVVYAPEDGVISEVKTSPFGYGKVLFFKGASGKTWVFAHQSSFGPKLDEIVYKKMYDTKKNDISISPKIAFKKGDTLTYAGSSGIGNPHLHLEVRTADNKALSPCGEGVLCLDTIAPQVFAAAAFYKDDVAFTSAEALDKGCVTSPIKNSFQNDAPVHVAFKIADYSREPKDVRAYYGFYYAMRAIARGEEPEPIVTIEDITIKDPDKSKWESFCGKYEHPKDFDLIIDEVYMKDGDLWAKAIDDDGDPLEFKFYPIGENKFGRKGGMLEVTFGENCLMIEDFTCKKL